MTAPSLTAFLLARYAEDEAVAREAHYDGQRWYSEEETVDRWPEICDCGCPVMFAANRKIEAQHIARHDPARVLADVEAKRAIVEECAEVSEFDDPVAQWLRDAVLRALALPHADHDDYREEWKP